MVMVKRCGERVVFSGNGHLGATGLSTITIVKPFMHTVL